MKKALIGLGVILGIAGIAVAASDLLPSGNYFAPGGSFAVHITGIHVQGWSFDPDTPTVSNNIAIYINGPKGVGTLLATVPTTLLRSDVNTQFGIIGFHGFDYLIPAQYEDNLPHQVFMYGVDTSDPTLLFQLPNSPTTINSAP